jgi:hypothetical protein
MNELHLFTNEKKSIHYGLPMNVCGWTSSLNNSLSYTNYHMKYHNCIIESEIPNTCLMAYVGVVATSHSWNYVNYLEFLRQDLLLMSSYVNPKNHPHTKQNIRLALTTPSPEG